MYNLKYKDGQFEYADDNGKSYYSTDGIAWTVVPETNIEVSPFLPTKQGYVQMVVLPVKIIDGCVSNVR